MKRVRARGEDVRRFILEHAERAPTDLTRVTAERFHITRQAVNKHIRRLVEEGTLRRTGNTRGSAYRLASSTEWQGAYDISPSLAEDVVWTQEMLSVVGPLPDNVLAIWQYGFTEMFNNAIDHSSGSRIEVRARKTATTTEMILSDNGVGIFRKIQAALNLLDERHAVLELSKGKVTTDPKRHTGEGIFFTSRMFDKFEILSGGVFFSHELGNAEDWILELPKESLGTAVWMKLNNHTSRTTKKIFDQYSSGDEYGFTKTVVPVNLARYGDDLLISRSQAKRLLARVELFKTVIFDFKNVESIGPAFADEIFRVFAHHHPKIEIVSMNINSAVKRMIERAKREPSGL